MYIYAIRYIIIEEAWCSKACFQLPIQLRMTFTLILLPSPSECGDDRCVPLCLTLLWC